MTRQGRVTKIENQQVWISTVPLEACCQGNSEGGCQCSGGTGVTFRAGNPQNLMLRVGDEVEVVSSGSETWMGVVKVLLPGVFLGALSTGIFYALWGPSQMAFGGFLGFLAGLAVNLLLPKTSIDALPRVEKVVPQTFFIPKNIIQ